MTTSINTLQSLFENLLNKGYIKEEDLNKIYSEECFKFLKNTEDNYNNDKCLARIWETEKNGNVEIIKSNVQCKNIKTNDGCFCSLHKKKDEMMPNGWWLGKINEAKPDPLFYPGTINIETNKYENPIRHYWEYNIPQSNVDEKQKKVNLIPNKIKEKKKRGRPPGSKNKKKVIKEDTHLHEEITTKYIVDGFAYSMNTITGDVIHPHTYEYMGESNNNGGINFIDEFTKLQHLKNVKSI